jgi:HD-GYP domain-containing protein (c-di-GMP phosphodiesterase class II)
MTWVTKMMKLDNSALVPGMILARDIFDLKSNLLIVSAGVTLTGELIDQLQQFPKIDIYVQELSAALQDEHEKLLMAKMDVSHERIIERVQNLMAHAGDQTPDPEELRLMVGDLEEQIELSSNVLLNLSHIKVYDDYLYAHVVNVAILALMIGKQLHLIPNDLHDLGIAALLHDYGMVKLDHSIYDHNRRLTGEEWEQVKRHPQYGVEMLQKTDQISPAILTGVAEHHERMDGSGYPCQKQGAELSLFGKIIGVADVYDACISHRKYRDLLTPHFTLKKLLSEPHQFDLEVLKAFVAVMSIYPIGSYVRLNTGEIGKVVGCNPNEPFRPDVRVILDRDQQKIKAPFRLKLNTAELRQKCFITGSLEEEQLRLLRALLEE